jgi:ureidoglycolate dehydrogenase (NAD+)
MKTISVQELTDLVVTILEKSGVGAADARLTADVLVTTDSWGVATHGTKLLRGYARRLRAGGLDPKGRPKIVEEGPAWAVVDGNVALGMVTSVFATKTAVAKARASGIAMVLVHNSCHFGAAGYYAHLAAQDGMICIAIANDTPSVAAPGSKGPVFGSNPFAFGAPGGSHPPVMLDMSTAVVAGGKIWQAVASGKSIPEGWLVDSEGRPTTDGTLYPDRASLLPVGGYKGYGLAIMIDVLSGVLARAAIRDKVGAWVNNPGTPTMHGHTFIVIDPKIVGGGFDTFKSGMNELIGGVKSCATVPGVASLMMPGEIEDGNRTSALKNGIPLRDDIIDTLREAAQESGVPFPASLA